MSVKGNFATLGGANTRPAFWPCILKEQEVEKVTDFKHLQTIIDNMLILRCLCLQKSQTVSPSPSQQTHHVCRTLVERVVFFIMVSQCENLLSRDRNKLSWEVRQVGKIIEHQQTQLTHLFNQVPEQKAERLSQFIPSPATIIQVAAIREETDGSSNKEERVQKLICSLLP